MHFVNLNDLRVQESIKQLCAGRSGVYKITNLLNNKCYVGSAVSKTKKDNRLYVRFRNHFFNSAEAFVIREAILKYGVDNFSFEILEFTDLNSTRDRETHYIQTLTPEYNVLKFADSSLGFKHSEETKRKMKEIYSDERRQRIGNLNKGREFSEEHRKKLSEAANNKTPEQKAYHHKVCDQFNQETFAKETLILHGDTQEVIATYPSLKQAADAYKANYRTFKRLVSEKRKSPKFNIYVKYSS